jgi:hypothetical protein
MVTESADEASRTKQAGRDRVGSFGVTKLLSGLSRIGYDLPMPIQIYIVYDDEDRGELKPLERSLKIMNHVNKGRLNWWYRNMKEHEGEDQDELKKHWVSDADIIVLLSSDALDGDHFDEIEEALLQRQRGAAVIPIRLKPTRRTRRGKASPRDCRRSSRRSNDN